MPLRNARKKIKYIIPEVPKGYKAHPFSVDGYYKMPEKLEQILNGNGIDHNKYKGTFIIPPQAYLKRWFGKRYVPLQALLFDDTKIIHVRDSLVVGKEGDVRSIFSPDLLFVKLDLCLLYGKLDIECVKNGSSDRVVVEYNTVGHRLLEPYLKSFLKGSWNENDPGSNGKEVYKRLKKIPIKYRNGVTIYVLSDGENLQDFFYIPRLKRKIAFININVLPDILLALTDKQLVILQDDLSPTSAYSWLLTYIPIENFDSVSFKKDGKFTEVEIKVMKSGHSKKFSLKIEDDHVEPLKGFFRKLY